MNFDNFKWLNESKITIDGGKIAIVAPPKTDFFNNPVPENGVYKAIQKNAPFFYTEITGDFVAHAKVKPNFQEIYDACCIMVIHDEKIWLKAAFEKSDFDTTPVVSVVTNGVSDDANGCNIMQDSIWLQVARVGNNLAVHYSLDGKKFDMVRLCMLPMGDTVKVGLEAQCPMGDGGVREFEEFSIENRSVKNLRAGL